MDVTRSNFMQLLPVISDVIEKADFLCIDGEFTGLRTGRDVGPFNTPSEYYQIVRHGSTKFLMVQFGLCAFRFDQETNKFKHCSFNFYIFPKPAPQYNSPDRLFMCQSSCIEFLVSQKFDFNKLFHEGIPYLTPAEECKVRERLEEKHAQQKAQLEVGETEKGDVISVPADNQTQIDDICSQVEAFLDGDEETVEFTNLNGFVRKLVYQEVRAKFEKRVHIETKILENQKRVMIVSRERSDEEIVKQTLLKQDEEMRDLDEAVGFSLIARKISESRKLVVGHSLLMDLLLVLNQFFSPLPEDYEEFKDFSHCVFPNIIDTMYLASLPQVKDKISGLGLNNLTTSVSQKPFNLPQLEPETEGNLKGYPEGAEKYHEAGFDAFMTGKCLIGMCDYLVRTQTSGKQLTQLNAESPVIRAFLNKLFLFKTAFQESPFMNLTGKDPNPSRDHIFHLEFPKDWKKTDIFQLFSPFGPITVQWIDDTSAYVGLRQREHAAAVMKALCPSKTLNCTVTPYRTYKASQLASPRGYSQNTSAPSYDSPSGVLSDSRVFGNGASLPSTPNLALKRKHSDTDLQQSADQQMGGTPQQEETKNKVFPATPHPRGAHPPPRKRQRTPSGSFKVTPKEQAEGGAPEAGGPRVFRENDDWS